MQYPLSYPKKTTKALMVEWQTSWYLAEPATYLDYLNQKIFNCKIKVLT
jgi:hypothetical protein